MPRLSHVAFAAIAVACLMAVPPALAQTREPVSARISYADLDLATAKGRATLARRLHRIAAGTCTSSLGDIAGAVDRSRCRQEMEDSGTRQITALIRQHDDVRLAAADPR
ncbi:UrcA family protein [Sphingomonas abietis]|uniref:UrcA family protein n=1 Tax=Sphingomonas abietis TaxID=3012344 RepID=A0ABY7NK74_9SPHN|nr:UrcA family protein [Sphingomonas abietis]WBO21195.1 UrcA family protein [Sphingomonas abietis]